MKHCPNLSVSSRSKSILLTQGHTQNPSFKVCKTLLWASLKKSQALFTSLLRFILETPKMVSGKALRIEFGLMLWSATSFFNLVVARRAVMGSGNSSLLIGVISSHVISELLTSKVGWIVSSGFSIFIRLQTQL